MSFEEITVSTLSSQSIICSRDSSSPKKGCGLTYALPAHLACWSTVCVHPPTYRIYTALGVDTALAAALETGALMASFPTIHYSSSTICNVHLLYSLAPSRVC
uniref:Uncharacterized protein n=1 Tax=Ditylenchus dipsaci TaxID=166011 RepID=A0A915D1C1_9BILA